MCENYKVNYTHSRTIVCQNFCEGIKLQLWLFYSRTYGFLSQIFLIEVTWGGLEIEDFCDFTAPPTGVSENVAHWD